MIFDNLFNKPDKKSEKSENSVQEKPAKSTEVPDAVKTAMDEMFPKAEYDVRKIPEKYTYEQEKEAFMSAKTDNLIILAEFLYTSAGEEETDEEKKKLLAIVTAIYAQIQLRMRDADQMYIITDTSIATEYPFIADGEALMFFDEQRARQWCAVCGHGAEKPLQVRAIKKEGLGSIFVLLTVLGVQFIRFHPEINSLKIRQSDFYKCEIKTVTDRRVRFFMLSYVQLLNLGKKEQTKQAYAVMLGLISQSQYLVAGVDDDKGFHANTIADPEKKSWIPLFTDEAEMKRFLDAYPSLKPQLEKSAVKVISFSRLKGFVEGGGLSGVVVNPADVGLRINSELCLKMIENAEKTAEKNQE